MSSHEKNAEFESKIVAFLCNWCSYHGADLAGTSRFKYPPNIRVIRVMCSGSIDPVYVLKALLDGADIDRYLGGDGIIDEILISPDKPNQYLGCEEGFADLMRLSASYQPPPPQCAGLSKAEPPLSKDEAMAEAKRCLRCDLRLLFAKPILPPKKRLWVEFNQENVATIPEKKGVFQFLDEQEMVIYIKGAMNLKQELTDQLELDQETRYFMFIEDTMFSKRESEMLQHYIFEHGKMPKQNQELEDLF